MIKKAGDFPIFYLGVIVFGLVWTLFAFAIHAALTNNTLGADFATFWVGSRAALLEGQSPYSAEVTALSQQIIYQRPASPAEDQLAFAYPLPAVFLLLPVVWMSLDWAQAFWLALNILLLLSALFFLFPKTPGYIRFSYFLFYPVFFGLVLGNFAILISILILVFLQSLFLNPSKATLKAQIIAGVCLSFCIIKPQFAWAYLGLAVLLVLRNRLWPFFSTLVCTSAVLLGAAFLLVPDWPLQWVTRVNEYAAYVKGQPALSILLTHVLPQSLIPGAALLISLAVISISIFLIVCWWKGRLNALLLIAWAGFITYLIHPHGISYEQITFILPFLLWVFNKPAFKKTPAYLWFAAILLSWILFFLTFFKISLIAVNEFPFLFYITWMMVIFINSFTNGRRPVDSLKISI
ncbi:MAG: glycosyltransferase 87 family protein [Anaerolineae bacterium]|nr:glycosyltransferase 87 family protein [Anaerolineae bacterium]